VSLTHQDLHGIYRLRRQIEPEIAARSCLLLADEDFERLDEVVKTFADERLGIAEWSTGECSGWRPRCYVSGPTRGSRLPDT
jgi:DNA-binding FadR family transcriptional regulator